MYVRLTVGSASKVLRSVSVKGRSKIGRFMEKSITIDYPPVWRCIRHVLDGSCVLGVGEDKNNVRGLGRLGRVGTFLFNSKKHSDHQVHRGQDNVSIDSSLEGSLVLFSVSSLQQ
jgi:hypothetical protein